MSMKTMHFQSATEIESEDTIKYKIEDSYSKKFDIKLTILRRVALQTVSCVEWNYGPATIQR